MVRLVAQRDGESIGTEKRRSAGVTHEAIESIRELIVSGEWGPGTRLPREAELAAQLGLSRNSLRETVRALSLARVLEVRQGDGTYVSSLEPHDLLEPTRLATHLLRGSTVLELFEVRRMLEPEAAAMAALRADDEIKNALRRELDRMFDAGKNVEDLVEADAAFHDVIAQAPGNAVLHSLLQSLSTRTLRARLWYGMADRIALDRARAEHTRIYDAIVAGDPDLARAATTVHIASNEAWLRDHLGPSGDVPLEGDAASV
jgi:GntR family transcriptional repressor for pyruvate dehydrogenase complex